MTNLTKFMIILWIVLTIAFIASLFKLNLVLFICDVLYGILNGLAVIPMLVLLKNNKTENQKDNV